MVSATANKGVEIPVSEVISVTSWGVGSPKGRSDHSGSHSPEARPDVSRTYETQRPAVVDLAHRIAAAIPPPPADLAGDPVLRNQHESLFNEAASGIAEAVGDDHHLLRALVGPPIEIGVNPPWRQLLEVAMSLAQARDTGHPGAWRSPAVCAG
jgi:hypothetical protein